MSDIIEFFRVSIGCISCVTSFMLVLPCVTRFNFSSPGQLARDVDSMAAGIETLTSMGDSLNRVIEKKPRR